MGDEPVVRLREAVRYRYEAAAGNQDFVRTDIGAFGARVLGSGERTELVTREGADVFCLVRSGSVRVSGPRDDLIAELRADDGVVIPAGHPYALEATSDAEVLEFHAATAPLTDSYRPFAV